LLCKSRLPCNPPLQLGFLSWADGVLLLLLRLPVSC
jgi:hypothetical protein